MLFTKQVKSFTLLETLVALVLMVIIIGLASSIIAITTSSLKIIKENESTYRDYEQAEFILSLDFAKYGKFYYQDSIITCKNNIDSMQYHIARNPTNEEIILLRKNDTVIKDRFKLQLYLHGNEVSTGGFDAIELTSLNLEQGIFIAKPQDFQLKLIENGF